ncbi:GNAT family N-acetyltransferase [Kribbella antibiotica]|uniref:GNAT family N-acetyltransferase n=2 Tax=Kribbella antibiotica TaxID=190195 RepID=A0A4R4YY15_9ACTN|nr:GNAT family N-acetyltransferase [Kribbella antibiotica]
MAIELGTATVGGLGEVVTALREWQGEGTPHQLHPGDVGWYWRFGAEQTAAALRTWRRDGAIVALGLLDEADLVRIAFDPSALQDAELAEQVAADVAEPARGVLVEGKVYVEAPPGALVKDVLFKAGWSLDEPWVPLRRDLSEPVPAPELRVDVIGAEEAHERVTVQRESFEGSTFTNARWFAMADGIPYADARCLVGRNQLGESVAAVTVWSAGEGKPGYLEPMGVHRMHRGRGYGEAITLAAARALQEMGASSANTCTPGFNVGAVATYEAAGFVRGEDLRDLRRDA